MEILSSKVRVSIGYQKRREPYVLNSYVNEYNLIQDSLNLFQIEADDWEEWVLIIGETNSRARCSDHLRDGDSLTLVRKVKVDLSSCQLKKETVNILEEKEKEKEDKKTMRMRIKNHSQKQQMYTNPCFQEKIARIKNDLPRKSQLAKQMMKLTNQ